MLSINTASLDAFLKHLREQEYSPATIAKYAHDVQALLQYAPEGIRDKEHLNGFRAWLEDMGYSGASVNSMLGAVNCYLAFLGSDWRLKYVRVQRRAFLPADRELSRQEYESLVSAALEQGDRRLALIVQTLCALGLRISELKAVTVESLAAGEASIHNKGKLRTILIPDALCRKLRAWCYERGIRAGCVFVTRTGRALDRSNVWKMLKRLAEAARVLKKKVFPHNLRHLFARTHYERFKDIVRLADILGHSSIDTTRIYTARSGKEERRQLGQLRLIL